MNDQKPVRVGCTDDPRVRQKIAFIRAEAVDRMGRGWSEMNMLIPRGKRLPGVLRGEHIDGGSLSHDLFVVKCAEVKAWADALLSNTTLTGE
jgi:hypothetical protein